MSIFLESNEPAPELQCVRELRLEAHPERLSQMRWFYEDLLGLAPWPPRAQIPGGWGMGPPWCGLYLQMRHDPEVHPVRRRLTLIVASLDRLEMKLQEAGLSYTRVQGLSHADRRILMNDPAGHCIELRQSRPL